MLGLLWFVVVVIFIWYAGKTADTAQRKREDER